MIQGEISRQAPLYGTATITASGTEGYVKVELEDDYLSLYQIFDSDLNAFSDYKFIGNDLYVPYNFNGTYTYRKIPNIITSLDDEIEYDNQIARTILPNGLAAQLLLDENSILASYFNQRYEEMLFNIKTKKPSGISTKTDVYDSTFMGV